MDSHSNSTKATAVISAILITVLASSSDTFDIKLIACKVKVKG